MFKRFTTSLKLFCLLTLVTGVLYPLLVTATAQLLFPAQANGSLIWQDGVVIGSALIGQPFTDPVYFWGRPSAVGYQSASSGGSNLGPTHPALIEAVRQRAAALRAAHPGNANTIPVDLVTASASGLDAHISVDAARYQAERVARARGMDPDQVNQLIGRLIEDRQLGFLGERRVNVLLLNLELDAIQYPQPDPQVQDSLP